MVSPPLCSSTSKPFFSFSSVVRSSTVGRRIPIVGAICVLTLGLSNFYSSPFKTGFTHSLSSFPLLRSKQQSRSFRSTTAMAAASSTTVPSIVVYVTVPNKEAGKKLAESIVKERLAACVNRVPGIESVYEWKGEIQTDSEELLIIKTRESLLDTLTEHVKANHEYEVPEVIAMPIVGGNAPYLEWLKNSTRD
ncbi:protein CutA, chloroplastic [Amaranthus tricolor]|uniref:protein CutA, chloroplastic n=1 Tax=Amaranthus tricolor TaxID=29722 RepID=UPI0025830663|nr:protein CutA, chloroplastic [Amaranthus tricolor]